MSHLSPKKTSQITGSVFERRVDAYLSEHHNTLVICLDSSLRSRIKVLEYEQLNWFDIKLNEAKTNFSGAYQENRYNKISGSLENYDWLYQLRLQRDQKVLFVCPQALVNCPAHTITSLFEHLSEHFPEVDVIVTLHGENADQTDIITMEEPHEPPRSKTLLSPLFRLLTHCWQLFILPKRTSCFIYQGKLP